MSNEAKMCLSLPKMLSGAVADPGFLPGGGVNSPGEGMGA